MKNVAPTNAERTMKIGPFLVLSTLFLGLGPAGAEVARQSRIQTLPSAAVVEIKKSQMTFWNLGCFTVPLPPLDPCDPCDPEKIKSIE
jgi:hypothetical protein